MDLSHLMDFAVSLPFWLLVLLFVLGYLLGLLSRAGGPGMHR
jgi:hypothetical protein